MLCVHLTLVVACVFFFKKCLNLKALDALHASSFKKMTFEKFKSRLVVIIVCEICRSVVTH